MSDELPLFASLPKAPASSGRQPLRGLLFIGDAHLCARAPGFRKDDYPNTILAKLRWALDYAKEQSLKPILLGDVFNFPRDNANWMLVQLLGMMDDVLAISGNHDCKENELGDNDTLSLLIAAGAVRMIDRRPWSAVIGGRPVIVGGTSWGQALPEKFDPAAHLPGDSTGKPTVFWATHHDLRFPGYEEQARLDCRDIPGVDVVVNGHIHRQLRDVRSEGTVWLNPGSIARVKRGDASREHVPGILRIDFREHGFTVLRLNLPHQPFEDVFHPQVESAEAIDEQPSLFIRGLADLESVKTASGAGLRHFLESNMSQFEPAVADEIRKLANEVLDATA